MTRDGANECGCSGEAASGDCRRPECAYAREGQAVGTAGCSRLTLVDGSGGPLRGEKPKKSLACIEDQAQEQRPGRGRVAEVLALVGGGSNGQRQERRARPPRDLEAVFAVVSPLWARLDRSGARGRVVAVARRELAAIAGLVGKAVAERLLAERLMRRLVEQGGPAEVRDPVGWFIGRGLPRRADCADPRCDEGLRLDTGGPCETCGYLVADRRALRHQVAAKVDAAMPTAIAMTVSSSVIAMPSPMREALT